MLWLKIIAYLIIFILLFVAFFLFKNQLNVIREAREKLLLAYEKIEKDIELKAEEMDSNYILEGESSSSSFLMKVENLLRYSRISAKYPRVTLTSFLLYEIVGACLVFILCISFSSRFFISVGLAVLWVLVPVGILRRMANKNYKRTQQQFIPFLNMVATASESNNEILSLLEDACLYVSDPISSAIAGAVAKARASGKVGSCVRELSLELEYKLFGRFIRSLELCSRHNSNFKKIVDDYRPDAEAFIGNDAKVGALYDNGRVSCLLLVGLSLAAVVICGNIFRPLGIFEILELFLGSTIGNIVLLIMCLLYTAVFFLLRKPCRR